MIAVKRQVRMGGASLWALIAGVSLLGACASKQGDAADPSDTAETDATEETLDTDAPEESWGDEDAEQAAAPAPSPSAEPEANPSAPETRTLEVIQKVVAEKRAAVRACYDKAREKNPALPGGDFVVRMVIDPEGVVKSAEQDFDKSTVKSPDLSKCALAEIQTWKFPPSSKGMETRLNYPFNFKP